MASEFPCTCELVDVTTNADLARGEYRFVRGLAGGCLVHESDAGRVLRLGREAEEGSVLARQAAAITEAMRRAREVP